jgi:hypothetical protein
MNRASRRGKKPLGRHLGRSLDESVSPYSESSSPQHSSFLLFSISCCSYGAAAADLLSSWRFCASCALFSLLCLSILLPPQASACCPQPLARCHATANLPIFKKCPLMRKALRRATHCTACTWACHSKPHQG